MTLSSLARDVIARLKASKPDLYRELKAAKKLEEHAERIVDEIRDLTISA